LGEIVASDCIIKSKRELQSKSRSRRLSNGAIVIKSKWLRDVVVCETGVLVVAELKSILLALHEVAHRAETVHAIGLVAGAAANGVERKDTVVQTHPDELVCGIR